jgi:hypothetical protein
MSEDASAPWFICPICNITNINSISESGLVGACCLCRDAITPSYIPKQQKDQFVRLYLKENYELYSM